MARGTLTVYTASAGSGKTYTLAAEYIALLLQGNRYAFRNILAVTFTNKATAEMKERIIQYLYNMGYNEDFSHKDFFISVKNILQEKGIIYSNLELQTRAKTALSDLLHDFDNFRVETIDSFFQSLLTSLAHDLGLSASFRVELNDKEVIKRAVDRLIIKVQNNSTELHNMVRYVEKKINEDKNWDFRKDLRSFSQALLNEEFMKHREAIQSEIPYVEKYEKKLYSYQKELVDGYRTTFQHLKERITELEIPIAYENILTKYINDVLEGNIKNFSQRLKDKATDAKAWLSKSNSKKVLLLEKATELQKILAHGETYIPKLIQCKILLDKLVPLRLLMAVSKEVNLLNEENNNFLLKNTPQLFAQLVQADADFVFERVGTRFNHIMIDEFQDTSRLQWQNFRTLFLENISAGYKNMVVGDIKQSIYRWRNGDWKILGKIKEEASFLDIEEKKLDYNHRSGYNIVEFNNTFFQQATKLLDEQLSYKQSFGELYRTVEQKVNSSKGKGYLRLCLYNENKDVSISSFENAFSDMAHEIRLLHQYGMPYCNMAILVRRNKEATQIVQYFQKFFSDIPIVSHDAFKLNASPAVMMLVNALQALNFQYNAESINEGKQKRMASLIYLAKEYQIHICKKIPELTELIKNLGVYLPEVFLQEREVLRKLPLFELCERLIAILQLPKLKGQSPYLFFFLDCVLNYLGENTSSISSFLEYWQETLCEKSLPMATPNGVQVLTIHKSKGLAFPAVFIPSAEWDLKGSSRNKENIHWTDKTSIEGRTDQYVTILPVNLTKEMEGTIYEDDYLTELFEKQVEELNAAYVAFTRPRTHLYIWSKLSTNKKETKLTNSPKLSDLLFDYVHSSISNKEETTIEFPYILQKGSPLLPSLSSISETQQYNPLEFNPQLKNIELSLYNTRFEFKQSNNSHAYLLNKEDFPKFHSNEYILKGNLFHEIFSCIHTPDDVQSVIDKMNRQGLFSSNNEADTIKKQVENFLKFPPIKEWFDGSWQLFNECTILHRTAKGEVKQLRPDRVMFRNNHTIVIDYKFGKAYDKYKKQILQYIHLLEKMGYPNITGYIWYVFAEEIETILP